MRQRSSAEVISGSTWALALLIAFDEWVGPGNILWALAGLAVAVFMDVVDAKNYEGDWLYQSRIVRHERGWIWKAGLQTVTVRDLAILITSLGVALQLGNSLLERQDWPPSIVALLVCAALIASFHRTWFGFLDHQVTLQNDDLTILRGGEGRAKAKTLTFKTGDVEKIRIDRRDSQLELSIAVRGKGHVHLVYGSKERLSDDDITTFADELANRLSIPIDRGT